MKYQYQQEEKVIITKIKSIIQKVNNNLNSSNNSLVKSTPSTSPSTESELLEQQLLFQEKEKHQQKLMENKYIYNSHPNHSSPFRKPIKKSSSYYELLNGTVSVGSAHFDEQEDDSSSGSSKNGSGDDEPPIGGSQSDQLQQQQLYLQQYISHGETRPRVESIDDWFRQPEDWEINLKYLYKWKWRVEMEKHFRRYRKNRIRLIPQDQFLRNSTTTVIEEEEDLDFEWNSLPHDPLFLEQLQFNLDSLCNNNDLQIVNDLVQSTLSTITTTTIDQEDVSSCSPFINSYDIGDYDLDSLDEESIKDLDIEFDDESGLLYAVYRSPVLSGLDNHSTTANCKSRSSSIDTIIERIYIDEKLLEVNEDCPPTEEENHMFEQMLIDIQSIQIPTMESSNNTQQHFESNNHNNSIVIDNRTITTTTSPSSTASSTFEQFSPMRSTATTTY